MNALTLGRTAGTIVVLAGAIMTTGCSANSGPAPAPAADLSAASPAGTAGADDVDIVMVVDSQATLKEDYATIGELARSKSVVAIVRGTVTAVRDVYVERLAFRVLSLKVSESLRGQTGQQITVLEDGGVVPYATVAPDFPPKDGDPAGPRNPAGFVDFRMMGARHSEVGDDVVLFLSVNPNVGTPVETGYAMVSSVRGRFTLDGQTGQFVRALGSSDKELRAGYVKTVDVATLRSEAAAR